jgi:hypothetical protein
MRNGRREIAIFVMATSILASTTWADVLAVNPVPCVSSAMNARVTATVPSALTSPRVFFRANGQGFYYYLDLRRGTNGLWWAIFPAIESSTRSITYYVGGLDSSRHWTVSNPITLTAAAACPPQALTKEEQLAAEHLVIGLTSYDQPAVPVGFQCRGITNVIAANGRMRRADECRAGRVVLAANREAELAAKAALTAAALAGGWAIVHNQESHKQVSPFH